MPVLDITGQSPALDSILILGRMAFIGDEEKYRAFVSSKIARIALDSTKDDEVCLGRSFVESLLYAPSCNDISKQFRSRCKEGFAAGTIFSIIHRMAEMDIPDAGLRKAIYCAMEDWKKYSDDFFNNVTTKRLEQIFKHFIPVLHLWAGLVALRYDNFPDKPFTEDALSLLLADSEPALLLSIGEFYRVFGESTMRPKKGEPWLAPDITYSAPPSIELQPITRTSSHCIYTEKLVKSFLHSQAWREKI